MLLRPRQEAFVERAAAALDKHGNTLGVAPTGAGKTVMLSAVAGRHLAGGASRVLVLQHRDELVAQNRRTFHAIAPGIASGVVDGSAKEFHRPATFAMVQTLARNLDSLRAPDLLVIDEAHHAAARSYTGIIDRVRELNPSARILGVTATPNRGDGRALRAVFDNVADQIRLGELIASGHLVRPRTFVVDLGVNDELRQVRRSAQDFDMEAVAKIMDKEVLNDAVIKHWRDKAGGRRTVVFASTLAHADHVCRTFREAGVPVGLVSGDMADGERRKALQDFDRGHLQVVVNVAVLTEGWDCQPVDCVVLLRPSSYKSTMIQMVGRGLRPVDPERYPGIVKTDCIVLDFGVSTLMHGSLEDDVRLDGKTKGAPPKKTCPECEAEIPLSAHECAICGYVFSATDQASAAIAAGDVEALADFAMTEVDLFDASPFRWEDLWGDGSVMVANAFESWAMVVWFNGAFHALGAYMPRPTDPGVEAVPPQDRPTGMRHLAAGERLLAIAIADDFMRSAGEAEAVAKSKRWLSLPPTPKQLQHLRLDPITAMGITRYGAACRLTWKFNESRIRAKLMAAAPGVRAA